MVTNDSTRTRLRPLLVFLGAYLAAYPGDGLARTHLIEAADRAMYAAKRFARNQVFAAVDPVVCALADATHIETPLDEHALAGAVDALALLVDERHNNSGAHSSNVAGLAGQLAVELGCDPSQSSAIRVAARLHDIGKIAIPDAILLKPAPLTDAEWAQMKKHPIVGSDVLCLIPALRSIAPMVRAHHERWDGKGYPDGLAGEEIPLPARILCLADAFDAMIADRPYSEPMHEAAAMREVKRCAGTQFDPRVVLAMEHIYCPAGSASWVCNDATEHGAVLRHSELIHQA
jgi:two-component system cell cycle response regulator